MQGDRPVAVAVSLPRAGPAAAAAAGRAPRLAAGAEGGHAGVRLGSGGSPPPDPGGGGGGGEEEEEVEDAGLFVFM